MPYADGSKPLDALTEEGGEALKLLLGLMRGSRFILKAGEELLPTIFIGSEGPEHGVTENVGIIGLAGFPSAHEERERTLRAVGALHARSARWVAFIADAWVKAVPSNDPIPAAGIARDPDRSEAIVASWRSAAGDRLLIQQVYQRVSSDGRSAERIVFSRPAVILDAHHDYDALLDTIFEGARS